MVHDKKCTVMHYLCEFPLIVIISVIVLSRHVNDNYVSCMIVKLNIASIATGDLTYCFVYRKDFLCLSGSTLCWSPHFEALAIA